jgi:hemin uptake protein HemP
MSMNEPPPKPQREGIGRAEGLQRPARVTSESLLAGAPEVLIDHRGVVYRLRQTALGKLILTK